MKLQCHCNTRLVPRIVRTENLPSYKPKRQFLQQRYFVWLPGKCKIVFTTYDINIQTSTLVGNENIWLK